jgi:SAM-dependent methyltransferase
VQENCRHCGQESELILDLGFQPIANNLKTATITETLYPLRFYGCNNCGLYQTTTLSPDLIFGAQYPYMTSVSKSYVDQCNEWAKRILESTTPKSVLEIGCNDGHLLQNFKHLKHFGVDPSESVTKLARDKGLNVQTAYFSLDFANQLSKFDLIMANNVMAHTPNLNDFVEGVRTCLDLDGLFVFEVPNAKHLIDQVQFDTIYHEHYSHFSKDTLYNLFKAFDMKVIKYEDIGTHGGSIRGYVTHSTAPPPEIAKPNEKIDHRNFKTNAQKIKYEWLYFLAGQKQRGKQIAAFGSAAKGTVFLNYVGVDSDFINYCVDDSPLKQGKFIPGTEIQVVPVDQLIKDQPDTVIILPWNFRKEIEAKLKLLGVKSQTFGR